MGKRKKAAEVEVDPVARDGTMARLAAARVCAQSVVDQIDEALGLFVDPDEDSDGSERVELIKGALEAAGMATRALEAAEEVVAFIDPEECEPWDEDGDDDKDAH